MIWRVTLSQVTGIERLPVAVLPAARSLPTPLEVFTSYLALRVYLSSTAFHSGTLPKLR
jgi:hypothetical protein